MSDRLYRLCELAGIQPHYYDIWGQGHEVTQDTLRALLGATHFLDESTPDLDQALTVAESEPWHEVLPPVHVVVAGNVSKLPFRLQESDAEATLDWRINLESGIQVDGEFRPADLERAGMHFDDGTTQIVVSFPLPVVEELGYHRLEIARNDQVLGSCSLIVCPPRAYLPDSFNGADRIWGLAVQLYAVRSHANWGMGDYGDLRRLMNWASNSKASLIGLNPLHALFPHNPQHCSPYSPSSRRFQNVLLISVESIPEFAECTEARKQVASHSFQAKIKALRATEMVDYQGVAALKFSVLEKLFHHFRNKHLAKNSSRAKAFHQFQAAGGEDLKLYALYHTLLEYFSKKDAGLWGWPVWPEAYRTPTSPAVRTFAKRHAERVEWFMWLQWLADEQLTAVSRYAEDSGLAVGLYQDIAVGVDKGGAETWMHRDLYALDCRVGCPPDDFNLLGQDWGLPPWIPQRLRAAAYRPFIAMLRANMKYAGALRIDHVMGLMRLYWIPPGMTGDSGAYVSYPFRDLLSILALESQRNRCVIIGEDLGTVPDEVRHALFGLGVLTYRLFYFERQQDGHFTPPAWYPAQALVAATTHDLPTLKGFWHGLDIELRTKLDLFPNDEVRSRQIVARSEDRARLLVDLQREGLLPDGVSTNPDEVPELTPALVVAILRYIARAPARIALVQAEDMLGQEEQVNIPGTTYEHPNWRRKLPLELEHWQSDPTCQAVGAAMAAERGADS